MGGYSTGYCDVIDFCLRMALIDTLFEDERHFIIIDDPFVDLDPVRLEHAIRLLRSISADSQIIYFVCHDFRAREPSSEEIAEIKHKALIKSAAPTVKIKSDSKKTRFIFTAESTPVLTSANRTITNGIFTVAFCADVGIESGEYELFFVDEREKVLCDRQQLSVVEGKTVPEKIRFCLNAGNALGNTYCLYIRNVNAAENKIARKYSYEAAITFTADFVF